jgi:hypothetical protein
MGGRAGNKTTPIISDNSLSFNLDADNFKCYPLSGNNIYNTIDPNLSGSFQDYIGFGTTWDGRPQLGNAYLPSPHHTSSNGINYFQFDGIDDSIDFVDHIVQNPTNLQTEVSFNFWFNIDQYGSLGLINEAVGNRGRRSRIILYESTLLWSISVGNQYIATQVGNDIQIKKGYTLVETITNPPTPLHFDLNRWYNLTFVQSYNGVKVYLDGDILFKYDFSPQPLGNYSPNLRSGTMIGAGAEWTYFFNGKMASVQSYNKALTQFEVKHNYDALKSRFT